MTKTNQDEAKTIQEHLLSFLKSLKKEGRSLNTIAAYRNDLSLFLNFLESNSIQLEDHSQPVQEHWLHFLSNNGRHSQASQRRAQMSVRSFVSFLISNKIISNSLFVQTSSLKHPSHSLFAISPKEYSILIEKIEASRKDDPDKSARDLALVLLLGSCGLKASEAAQLTWRHVFLPPNRKKSSKGSIVIPDNKSRIIPCPGKVCKALYQVKDIRQKRGLSVELDSCVLFAYRNISRSELFETMQRHGLKFAIYELCEEILNVPYHAESLRNHAILQWLESGLEKEKVCELAGYSSINSIERFLLSREKRTKKQKKV